MCNQELLTWTHKSTKLKIKRKKENFKRSKDMKFVGKWGIQYTLEEWVKGEYNQSICKSKFKILNIFLKHIFKETDHPYPSVYIQVNRLTLTMRKAIPSVLLLSYNPNRPILIIQFPLKAAKEVKLDYIVITYSLITIIQWMCVSI